MKYVTYVGTYTDAKKEGIHIFETDADTGTFRPIGLVSGIESPIYLSLSKTRPLLYAAQGMPEYGAPAQNGAVAVYAIKGDTLIPINHKPIGVTVPCYIALDPDEKALVFAEYTNAVAGVFELNADGSLADSSPVTVKHTGHGPDKKRQEKAHAHCSVVSPDGKYLCVVDLGIDRVKVYDFVNRRGGLKEVEKLTIASAGGAGPRHLIFHPNRKLAFLLHELNNTVSSFFYTGDALYTSRRWRRFPPTSTTSAKPRPSRSRRTASACSPRTAGTTASRRSRWTLTRARWSYSRSRSSRGSRRAISNSCPARSSSWPATRTPTGS